MISVLLVDDDPEARARLRRVLTADPEITVVGEASSGRQAVRMVQMLSPSVVLMDTDMPGMDGFQTTNEIMTRKATPIIMISPTQDEEKAERGFRAIEAGAVAMVAMPSGTGESHGRRETELVQTVRTMSEVRVVHRRKRGSGAGAGPAAPAPRPPKSAVHAPATRATIELVAIGASTGGPQALQHVLAGLPRGFGAAVLVVQHITPDFQASFVAWLREATRLPVGFAVNGRAVERGHVYIAPHPHQMGLDRRRHIVLRDDPPENGLRPAASYLFRSVAAVAPRRTAAVLLTGMGQDGAAELLELRAKGAITIAQDEDTSIVHGMPGEAIRLGAAMHVLPPEEIGALLAELTRSTTGTADPKRGRRS